jgi:hypothetical protein
VVEARATEREPTEVNRDRDASLTPTI